MARINHELSAMFKWDPDINIVFDEDNNDDLPY